MAQVTPLWQSQDSSPDMTASKPSLDQQAGGSNTAAWRTGWTADVFGLAYSVFNFFFSFNWLATSKD